MLVGISLMVVIYFVSLYNKPCGLGEISIPYNDKDSKIMVGEKIIEQYLKTYKAKKTCPSSWISTYKISSVQANGYGAQDGSDFMVNIVFSVKPTQKNNSFWLNNGEKIDNNGWVNDKNLSLSVKKDGSFFKSIIK